MNIKIDEIEVQVKLSEKPNLRATAVLNLGDLTIKGFRLSPSEHENENLGNERLYLQPPSYRVGQGFQKVVFINDKEKWKGIEKKVFEAYKLSKLKADDDLWGS